MFASQELNAPKDINQLKEMFWEVLRKYKLEDEKVCKKAWEELSLKGERFAYFVCTILPEASIVFTEEQRKKYKKFNGRRR